MKRISNKLRFSALNKSEFDEVKAVEIVIRKYEEKGVQGLTDRRGKAKPENELTEEDRLRQENKILQAKIKDQEMEIALLKKLRELRGGGH